MTHKVKKWWMKMSPRMNHPKIRDEMSNEWIFRRKKKMSYDRLLKLNSSKITKIYSRVYKKSSLSRSFHSKSVSLLPKLVHSHLKLTSLSLKNGIALN